jgi:hypothetical protein
MTYSVETDWASDFSAAVKLAGELVQTGAGGAGAAAAEARMPVHSNARRFLRLRAVNSGAGNASAKSASLVLAF